MPNNLEIGLMQKMYNTLGMKIRDNVSLDSLIGVNGVNNLKVHTYNALSAWQKSLSEYEQFFKQFFSASKQEIITLRSCGQLTFDEIYYPQRATLQSFQGGGVPSRINTVSMAFPEIVNTNN